MPLPKSITSLLTAIVVAVPAAITTLALNKPKPPREIDAIIQLDENKEEIPENEIKPTEPPPPPLPPAPSQSSSSSGSKGVGGGGAVVETDEKSSDSSADSESSDSTETESETKEETKPETKEEKQEESEEEDDRDDEEDLEEPPTEPTPEQESNKDPSIQELEESIVSIIGILINEGKDFDIKNSRLYKQYTISSKLVELKKTIESWQAKKAEEAKTEKEKGSSPGTAEQTGK